MTQRSSATVDDNRRACVRRTVLFLLGCALASYGVFLYSALQHR